MTSSPTPETVAAGLSERDREVLAELEAACRLDLEWFAKGYRTGRAPGWSRPLDCGGTNSSDHSYRLSKLVKMGLAESKQRWGVSSSGRRGSKVYRPSDFGNAVRAHLQGSPQ